jgi:putative inorganic carbon (HCO3(-)) transporter
MLDRADDPTLMRCRRSAMMRVARLVASAELPILLAIAPALLFPTPSRLLVLVAVPIVWLCMKLTDEPIVPRTPMNTALALMLLMVGVSVYATFDVSFSLGKVSGVVLGILLFWATTRALTTVHRLTIGIAVFLLAGASLAIIGTFGVTRLGNTSAADAIIARLPWAIRGVPGAEEGFNPNPVAGCLVLFVPLQIALLAAPSSRTRFWPDGRPRGAGTLVVAIQVVLLILVAGAILLMQSRGAWVGLIVAIFVFLLWHSARTRVIASTVAALVVALAAALGPARMFDLTISGSAPGFVTTLSARTELWSRGLYGINDFAFTGMGMNTFRRIMPLLYPPMLIPPGVDIAHAHNHLLQAGLDLGVPGLIAYLAIWFISATLLIRVSRGSSDPFLRAVAGGFAGGLIAHFVFGMTDVIPLGSKVGVLFWFTLALVVALHRIAFPSATSSLRQQRVRTVA